MSHVAQCPLLRLISPRTFHVKYLGPVTVSDLNVNPVDGDIGIGVHVDGIPGLQKGCVWLKIRPSVRYILRLPPNFPSQIE